MNKRKKKHRRQRRGRKKNPVTSNEKRLNKIKWIYQVEYKYENILKYDKNISECVVKCRQPEAGVPTTGKAAEVVVVHWTVILPFLCLSWYLSRKWMIGWCLSIILAFFGYQCSLLVILGFAVCDPGKALSSSRSFQILLPRKFLTLRLWQIK